jgi:hypothetical protein
VGAGDVGAQPLGPLGSKVRVVAAPDEQGGVVEASQARQCGQGVPLVGGVELAGEEAPGLGASLPVSEVGLDVAVQELGGEHGRVVRRPTGPQRQPQHGPLGPRPQGEGADQGGWARRRNGSSSREGQLS